MIQSVNKEIKGSAAPDSSCEDENDKVLLLLSFFGCQEKVV
jgi:hypothetical protein